MHANSLSLLQGTRALHGVGTPRRSIERETSTPPRSSWAELMLADATLDFLSGQSEFRTEVPSAVLVEATPGAAFHGRHSPGSRLRMPGLLLWLLF